MSPVVECVPNFSEGRDPAVIRRITDAIESVGEVRLLHVDPGHAAHRTVVTFAGAPAGVVEAAFRAIRQAGEDIDLARHRGEHPRLGATDVCPLVPISGITMAETAALARNLAERVGRELALPVYLYEYAQPDPARRNLAVIRAGEYEGLAEKIRRPEWRPDFGPAVFDARRGATVIGARDFLVAYNINLDTTDARLAHAVACEVRESGRKEYDAQGRAVPRPGTLKSVKAIGWYLEDHGVAQVSLNLTNLAVTPLHTAYEEVARAAAARGLRVTGSELIGLVPRQALLEAGRHFATKQSRPADLPEEDLIALAADALGLSALAPFKPAERVIEYRLRDRG